MLLGIRAIAPIALAAGLLLAVAGGLVSSSAAPTDPNATTTPLPTTVIMAAQPVDDPTPAPVREAPLVGTLVTRYLNGRFGQGAARSDWYANIRSVNVRFGTVIVQTDLSDDPDDHTKATAIGQAVLGFQETESGQHMTGLAVEVFGQSGRLLVQDRAQPSTLGRAVTQQP